VVHLGFSTYATLTMTAMIAYNQSKGLQKCGPKMKLGSHISCSREVESMGECENWTSTLPSELPLWELDSRWTPEYSKINCRGQNPLDWGGLYNVKKLLEPKCLKWARMTHLDIWNASYCQKKGRESNCQIDSRPLKVKNLSISLRACGVQHTIGKLSMRAITLLETSSRLEVYTQSYGPVKL
jgi:hypothetical protein